MADSFETAQSLWAFEDWMRRCTGKLFEWSDNQEVIARRIVFRQALLDIAQGMADDNPLSTAIAFGRVAEEFSQLKAWTDYHDPAKGVEIEPDSGTEKKPWM